MKITLTSLAYILISITWVYGQTGYHIHIKMPENQENTFFLANYHGDKTYLIDTSQTLSGEALFTGNEPLKQGIYILANSKKEKLAEFLVGYQQHFTITFPLDFNPENAQVDGSIENILFFQHLSRINNSLQTIEKLKKERDSLPENSPQREIIQKQITAIQHGNEDFADRLIAENPYTLMALILKAMKDPKVPDSIKEKPDEAYAFFKRHYWDNFTLNDDRLIRTPLLAQRLKTYMEKLVPPVPDSVVSAIDYLMYRAQGAQEITDFLAWHFLAEYQQPKVMGLEKAFVHVADEYFLKGKVSGLTSSLHEKIKERADRVRPTLLGNQAPEMWLSDTTNTYRSFRELKSEYVVIVFWDQTCSHCKKELEELNKVYQKKTTDFEIFAVNTTNDLEGWKQYIREKKYPWVHVNGTRSFTPDFHQLYDIYSVPVIYILDKQRRIIAKRISAQFVEQIIASKNI